MNVAVALNILGLVLDIGGFTLVGRELLKHPGQRPWLGGGDREHRQGIVGFYLVVGGFCCQLLGQVVALAR